MKAYFESYEELEYIEPSAYYAGDYRYVETSFCDEDGEYYDIVYSNDAMAYYYTNI